MSFLPVSIAPAPPARVLLVGNYAPDRQESMLRFTRLLHDGLAAAGQAAEMVAPGVFFGRLCGSPGGVGKWLAYLDKYLIFPWVLRRRVRALEPGSVVHVCDHSNAVYAAPAASAGHPVLVTCHDLGAVRGALGEDTDCPASQMGRLLQRWISRSLGQADLIACVSTATQRDVERLIRRPDGSLPRVCLALNGLNAPFRRLDPAETHRRLARIPSFDAAAPFVLNVGSSLRRKNRAGVLRIFARLRDEWPQGRMVFAGEPLPEELRQLAMSLGIADRVTEVVKPDDATLEALYNGAAAFLFPSRFEGFGWPVVEAQACGCPVLSSDAGSLGEVVGDGGFTANADDDDAFARELRRILGSSAARDRWVEAGERNAARFGADAMIARYLALYSELLNQAAQPALAPIPAAATASR